MKNIILGIIFISLLISCKKTNTAGVSSGYWIFQAVTYNNSQGEIPGGGNGVSIVVTDDRSSNVYLVISTNSINKFASGIYSVGSLSGDINLSVTDAHGNPYIPVKSNAGMVSVYVSNDTFSCSSTGVNMVNYSLSDTSILTFHVTQTQ